MSSELGKHPNKREEAKTNIGIQKQVEQVVIPKERWSDMRCQYLSKMKEESIHGCGLVGGVKSSRVRMIFLHVVWSIRENQEFKWSEEDICKREQPSTGCQSLSRVRRSSLESDFE